ncbi:MAG TPA: S9 family peptidase [Candidatus Limnocylindria bacterium]|nr:S9 family peptidase [Candidatus Limnocylindria bacterium]
MAHRPLRDFYPDQQLRQMAHTTRRYAGRSALAISPDARAVAFVSDSGGTYEAWTIPAAGGAPSRALAVEGGAVHSLCWSASGDLVAAVDRGGTERFQLYVTRPDERIEPLSTSDGDRVQHLMSWNAASPDGRTLAISSNAREPSDVDVVLVDLATGAQRTVMTGPYWHVAGGWSPDGRSLLVMRVADNLEQTVFVVDAASGEAKELTPHEEEAQFVPAGWLGDGRALVMTDDVGGKRHLDLVAIDPRTRERARFDVQQGADIELAVTSADGRSQVWSSNADGYSTLHWQRDGRRLGSRALGGACEDLVVSRDGRVAAFIRQTPTEPSQLWVLDVPSGEARPILVTRTAVEPSELAAPELVRIPAEDGAIPAFVYRPKRASGRVPALLYPHGGPEGQSRPALNHVGSALQALVHRGIAVVVPNIHGSTGYGRAWQKAIHKDWGGIDLRDLRAVADWMAAEPGFDPARLGVFGGSYGGFASLTCATRIPERWRCAVDLFGVSNLVTMITTNQPNWQRFLRRWIGDLETDREKLMARSPVTYIDEVRCPMLVIQGANDPRVPKGESDQVVERLRARGRRVEYLVFEDEGHGFTRRANQEQAYEAIVEFLTRELLG